MVADETGCAKLTLCMGKPCWIPAIKQELLLEKYAAKSVQQ